MTDAEFFAAGHRLMKRVISWGPSAFGVRLGVAVAALLLPTAAVIGVHTFPLPGDDRGFWFEPNWSLMFVVVFPAIFGGLIYMISLMREALARLTSEDLRVITKGGAPAADFEAYISNRLSSRAGLFSFGCAVLAAILTGVHGAGLAQFLITRAGRPPVLDWTTKFTTGTVSFGLNVAYDIAAYSMEAVTIFIGFFFVLKFWMFLYVFSRSLRDESTEYVFQPLIYDPDRTLGLRPLGAFMNLYLLLVIVFELYVLGRRLQMVGKAGDFSVSGYLVSLAAGAQTVHNVVDQRMYQWHTIDPGLWALLIFLTLPLVVAAYFPLWTLRRYVRKRRDSLWAESARAHEAARMRGDDAEAEKLAKKMSQLEGTQLWPNGDARGWRLLAASIAIGLAAWAPPLCASLLALVIALEIGKWFLGLRRSIRQ